MVSIKRNLHCERRPTQMQNTLCPVSSNSLFVFMCRISLYSQSTCLSVSTSFGFQHHLSSSPCEYLTWGCWMLYWRFLNMESTVFDNVRFEKEKAVARFNRFRRIVKLWQFFELLVVLGLVSWSSARVPAVMKVAGGYLVDLSAYVFNHHVVFIVGNIIIGLLFVICRQNDTLNLAGGGGDGLYDDYVKHSEAVHQREPPAGNMDPAVDEDGLGGDDEKQIVVCWEEIKAINPQRDEVTTAIEEATRQIRRFERTQSEKLKREIAVRPRLELRRSETEKYQRKENPETESSVASEIDTLSSEEFRLTIEAFIDKNWIKKSNLPNQFENYGNYHLVEMT